MDEFLEAVGIVLLIAAIYATCVFLNGWIFMVLWGAIVQHWLWPAGPHLGYWTATLICLGLSLFVYTPHILAHRASD